MGGGQPFRLRMSTEEKAPNGSAGDLRGAPPTNSGEGVANSGAGEGLSGDRQEVVDGGGDLKRASAMN